MTDEQSTDSEHVNKLKEALEQNLYYQETIESNIKKLQKILIANSEKQRLLKSKVEKFDLHTFISTPRGPKRPDFFRIPHWTFDTMDETIGTVTPKQTNIDILKYRKKLGKFQLDHTHLRFSLTEQRALSKALANTIRLFYLEDLHKKHSNNSRLLQDELNQIRKNDARNALWPLQYWQNYPISWKRIAKENMPGRTASECEVFWNGHDCYDNPSINRKKTWTKEENKNLIQIVEGNEEKDWKSIAEQHNYKRTALQCAQQWMRKLKRKPKVNRKWTDEEDHLLRELVLKHGKNNFLYIGSHFENRTALQCASRWLKSMAPYIRSGEWNETEDIQCVLSHNAYLPNIIPVVKSDIFDVIMTSLISDDDEKETKENIEKKKKKEKQKQKKDNVTVLAPRAGKHGVWVLIGRHITYRNDVKARERYMNVLDPGIDIASQWTEKEDKELIQYHEEYGDKWAFIARKMGGKRTDCYCRQRFKALTRHKKPKRKRKRSDDENEEKEGEVKEPIKKKHKKTKKKHIINNDIDVDVDVDVDDATNNTNNANNINNAEPRVITTRSKAKLLSENETSPKILKLPETYEFAEGKQKKRKKRKKAKKSKKDKRKSAKIIKIKSRKAKKLLKKQRKKAYAFTPIYLENDFSAKTNTSFIGRRPNRFIVNQPLDTTDRYIIPRKRSNVNQYKYEMLSMHNEYIDGFVEKERERLYRINDNNNVMKPLPIIKSDHGRVPTINNVTFPALSGQNLIHFSSATSVCIPSFPPIPTCNPFESRSNAGINNKFKIDFPMNLNGKRVIACAPAVSNVIENNTDKCKYGMNGSSVLKNSNSLVLPLLMPLSSNSCLSQNGLNKKSIEAPLMLNHIAVSIPKRQKLDIVQNENTFDKQIGNAAK